LESGFGKGIVNGGLLERGTSVMAEADPAAQHDQQHPYQTKKDFFTVA
jgi:hypothetical protein